MEKILGGEDFEHIERSNRKNVVPGAWRVEVSPEIPAEEDLFLHLLEIGDRGTTGKKRVEMLKGHNVAGAAFESGTVALFNTTNSPVLDAEVTIPDMVCSELLITGLQQNALFELIFAGPNLMTPTSAVPPGVEVQTRYFHSNEKGVLTLSLKELRNVRMRISQV